MFINVYMFFKIYYLTIYNFIGSLIFRKNEKNIIEIMRNYGLDTYAQVN